MIICSGEERARSVGGLGVRAAVIMYWISIIICSGEERARSVGGLGVRAAVPHEVPPPGAEDGPGTEAALAQEDDRRVT